MSKAISKLFRDHQKAHQVLKQLHSKGYKIEDIGLLLNTAPSVEKLGALTKGAAREEISLPEGGNLYGIGPLATALQKAKASKDIKAALQEALDSRPEACDYYVFGISMGGILVSVHGAEEHLVKAAQVMRGAEVEEAEQVAAAKKTGFAQAGRMSATDPMDAPMSGDFRRY